MSLISLAQLFEVSLISLAQLFEVSLDSLVYQDDLLF
jgi:hypothetical protein